MRETFSALLTQIRKVWLNRKFVFPVAVAVCALGWTVVSLLPDVFEGSATLYVDTKTLLGRVLDRVAVDTEELDAEFVALARQRLLSRPNIERLLRDTDLDLGAQDPKAMDRLVSEISQTIDIRTASTTGGTRDQPNIFVLQIHHQNPVIAKKMIESLVDIFSESVLGSNRQSSDQTQQFLDEQIAQYQKKLDETEKRLTEFRRLNPGLMPDENTNLFADLQATRRALDEVRSDLARAVASEQAVRRQLGASSVSAGSGPSPELMAKQQEWAKLNAELGNLLAEYTEQHPKVLAVRKRLQELNFNPNSARGSAVPASSGDTNALQFEFYRVQAEIAGLRDKEREYTSRIGALQSSIDQAPGVAAEYQVLTRDYDVNKQQYTALVQRRESARLSREAELTTNQVQFQVIEPPHVGTIPVEPKRGLLLTAVLAGGFGLAAAIGFLMSQIKPTFGDIRELEAATGLTAYGTIGVVRNAADTRAHRIEYLAYIGVFLALLAVYIGLVAWLADDFKSMLG